MAKQQNRGIASFQKGIQKDSTKLNQPKGSYRHALNAVHVSDDGDYYALTNERGAEYLGLVPNFNQVIGRVVLDKEVILFQTNTTEDTFELGLIDENKNYQSIFTNSNVPDYNSATDLDFSFTISKPNRS